MRECVVYIHIYVRMYPHREMEKKKLVLEYELKELNTLQGTGQIIKILHLVAPFSLYLICLTASHLRVHNLTRPHFFTRMKWSTINPSLYKLEKR